MEMLGGSAGGFPGGGWGGVATGIGAASDLAGAYTNWQAYQQRAKLQSILQNPKKFAAYINNLNQPLSASALQAINRDINANLALRGMGSGGGASNQFAADALAKIEAQRQQAAMQSALGALTGGPGLPTMPIGATGQILMNLIKNQQMNKPQGTFPAPQTSTGQGPYVPQVGSDIDL